MKISLFLLSLTAISGLSALAQVQAPVSAKAAPGSVDPAARAILQQAIQSYKGASGIEYRFGRTSDFVPPIESWVRYPGPDKIRIEVRQNKKHVVLLNDGKDFYVVDGTQYRKAPKPDAGFSLSGVHAGTVGGMMEAMIAGRSPMASLFKDFKQPFRLAKLGTVSLGQRTIDGEVLQGVKETTDVTRNERVVRFELTAWFGGSPLTLRRTQLRSTYEGFTLTARETISEQQISPSFPDGTFVFDSAGLSQARDENARK